VYPNPSAGGIVNISFSSDWAGKDAVLSVNSISGQMICTERIQIPEEGVAGVALPLMSPGNSGIYILTVTGKNIIRHTKLIIR